MWGRSVSRLLENLPEQYRPPRELVDAAKELDRHYVAARYPNSYPEGAPMDYYTEADARRAVDHARRIIEFCRSKGL